MIQYIKVVYAPSDNKYENMCAVGRKRAATLFISHNNQVKTLDLNFIAVDRM